MIYTTFSTKKINLLSLVVVRIHPIPARLKWIREFLWVSGFVLLLMTILWSTRWQWNINNDKIPWCWLPSFLPYDWFRWMPMSEIMFSIGDFHKPSTIQECQYCQLCLSCAIRNKLNQWRLQPRNIILWHPLISIFTFSDIIWYK